MAAICDASFHHHKPKPQHLSRTRPLPRTSAYTRTQQCTRARTLNTHTHTLELDSWPIHFGTNTTAGLSPAETGRQSGVCWAGDALPQSIFPHEFSIKCPLQTKPTNQPTNLFSSSPPNPAPSTPVLPFPLSPSLSLSPSPLLIPSRKHHHPPPKKNDKKLPFVDAQRITYSSLCFLPVVAPPAPPPSQTNTHTPLFSSPNPPPDNKTD